MGFLAAFAALVAVAAGMFAGHWWYIRCNGVDGPTDFVIYVEGAVVAFCTTICVVAFFEVIGLRS